MNRDEKAAVVDQLTADIGGSQAVLAVDYRGITVAQIAELRAKLRDADTTLAVTKNTLALRAADNAGTPELKTLLVGPTALAFVRGDAAAAAKILADTRKALDGPLAAKGGLLDGQALSPQDVDAIAKLPSREVLYGQLVGTIAAPVSGLARTLNALVGGLAIALGQVAEQGLVPAAGAAAPAADAEAPAADAAAPAADAEAPAADAEAPAAEAEAPAPPAEEPAAETTSTETASDDATPTDA